MKPDRKRGHTMAFNIMSLKLDPDVNYILEVDAEKNSYIEIHAAAEKEWLKTDPKKDPARFASLTKVMFSSVYRLNSDFLHGGQKINPESYKDPQSLWYERLDRLKRSAEMKNPPRKRSPRKTNMLRFAYITCLVIAALSLLFPPFTNLLRNHTALIAEIVIMALGIVSLFSGAIAVTILAVLVLILIEDSLWWLIPAMSPFWQKWFAPGFIILVCLIAAAVFFVKYFNENVFLQKYLTFKNENLAKQIARVKSYRDRLEKLVALSDQAKDACLNDFVDKNPDNHSANDLTASMTPAYELETYYKHCLKDFDSYLNYLETNF